MNSLLYYIFDIETMPDIFLFTGKFDGNPQLYVFEISPRLNQRTELLQHLSYLQNCGAHMVGFNSLNFDWPIVTKLLLEPYTFTYRTAALMAQEIIGSQTYGQNPNHIRANDRLIPQIDLVKINHFDNANRRTSLKALEFAMRSESVEDLPFGIRDLTDPEKDQLRAYNATDVRETEKFLGRCKHLIDLRKELLDNGILSGDVLNFSDVKLGTEYLIKKIGRSECFVSGSKPRQTIRQCVEFKNIILPKIKFHNEQFQKVKDWFSSITIWVGGEERPKLEIDLAGLPFVFGLGGVHGSVENKTFETNEDYVICDVDVRSMYPSIAIANDFAPEHLGKKFSAAYRQLSEDRKQYLKGSTMNAVLKLANNGVFGNSNNAYSCFYDPKFTYSITVNGQLQALQLVELLALIPGLQFIQANTDGVTSYVRRDTLPFFHLWCNEWEALTGLKLEHVEYKTMRVADVNNYVATTADGKIKAKGKYYYPKTDRDYEGIWNKDFSNLSAQKGVEAVHLHGCRAEDVVRLISDPFDFMLRYKTPGGAKLYVGDKEQLKTVRYYVSTKGEPMKKIAQPKGEIGAFKRKNGVTDAEYRKFPTDVWNEKVHTKNKGKYTAVTTSVESGRLVKVCNRATDFNWGDVDWSYYVGEIEKLRIGSPNV